MSLRVLSVVGVCFASTAAFAQSTETPPLEAETTAPPASAGSSAPPESSGDGAVPPPDPHATQAESPAGQSAPLPGAAAPASGEHAIPDADATELAPVVVNPDAVKKRVAQAKPRTTSAGALTAPSFEPSQDLSVTPFSALTAEESSAISYTVSEAGVATKFDLPPREIPQTVVVTTQKLIKDFNLTDVKQILQFTPGIYVENERNVGAYQYFSRGYQLQVQFDGVPSAVRIGDRDAVSLDSAMIDRVEVLQGAAGLLTGAGAPGGTINIVRKMPTKTQSGYVEATAGPWDGGRLVADVSTPIDASGKVRARLVGVYNYDDSYIDYVYNRQGMFYGVVQADLTRTTLLTAGANVQGLDGSNGAAYGSPTAHDGSDLRLPRTLNLGANWPIRTGSRKTTSSSSTRTLAPNGSSRRRSRNISPTRTSSNPRPITASIRRPGRARASGAPRKPGTRMRPGSISTPRGRSRSSAASTR